MSGGYAVASQATIARPRGSKRLNRVTPVTRKSDMKLTLKQKIRNWLMDDGNDHHYMPDSIEVDSISSNGMRFNLYKASGGFVIETKLYDERSDRNINKLHVITEDKDLGAELGKIITMESLR
jgi:hypothetical protein